MRSSERHQLTARAGRKLAGPLTSNPQSRDGTIEDHSEVGRPVHNQTELRTDYSHRRAENLPGDENTAIPSYHRDNPQRRFLFVGE